MKMAKASEADLEMALELCRALEDIAGRWGGTMPQKIGRPEGDSDDEFFDPDDEAQCKRVVTYLRELVSSASLIREVWGMLVLLDPANKIVDPDSDVLEHHPAMLADGVRLRWLTEDHSDPDTREQCRKLLARMPMMSYSAATADIDAAIRECSAIAGRRAE